MSLSSKRLLSSLVPSLAPSIVQAPAKCVSVPDYHVAVRMGRTDLVQDWFKSRYMRWRASDEAAYTLALQHGHSHIAQLIQQEMALEHIWQERSHMEPCRNSDLYQRSYLLFDHQYYFSKIMFQARTNGQIDLYICYRTQLEEPYLKEAFKHLNANGFLNNYAIFSFSSKQAIEELHLQLAKIFDALIALKKKDGTIIREQVFHCFHQEIDAFMQAAANGFPHGNFFARNNYSYPKGGKQWHNVLHFDLYYAAINFDHNKMLELLRHGADPDTRFEEETLLHLASSMGTGKACCELEKPHVDENMDKVVKTVEVLLMYDADPNLKTHGETVMEYLVRYIKFLKSEKEKILYQRLIKLLAAPKTAKPHIDVHPSVTRLPVSAAVIAANHAMRERESKEARCIIKKVNDMSLSDVSCIEFLMHDDAVLQVETKRLSRFSKEEYESLFQLFEKIFPLLNKDKRKSFDGIMASMQSELIIDIIKHNNIIKGYNVTEVLRGDINQTNGIIYFWKLSVADLPEYPGFMRFISLMRGLSTGKANTEKPSITYYDASTKNGFALSTDVERFPVSSANEALIEPILKLAYDPSCELKYENGSWYIKDPIKLCDRSQPERDTPNMHSIWMKSYRTDYEKAGYVLAIAFLNTRDNYALFLSAVEKLIGKMNFEKTAAYFMEMNKKNVLVSQVRAKM